MRIKNLLDITELSAKNNVLTFFPVVTKALKTPAF